MIQVKEVLAAMEELAPPALAEEWDNVGLLVENPGPVTGILTALDITPAVVEEARALGCNLVVSHHPVIFQPKKTLRGDDPACMLRARGMSGICMHTNLDAAQGGVNDILAARLGLEQVEKLGDEEGIGRVGTLPASLSDRAFLTLVRDRLKPNGLRFSGGGRSVQRVAVGGGACGDMFPLAVEKGCDAFVTADVKYNQFLDAAAMGLLLVDAGHFPTEDPVCPAIAAYLRDRFPELTVIESDSHREIVQYYV